MYRLLLVFILMTTFFSCKKEVEQVTDEALLPVADFYITATTNVDRTISINIKNLSKYADTYVWYLDNNDSVNSFEPTFNVRENKNYKVTLKATNKYGSATINRFINIFSIPLVADFSVIINLDSPSIVRFKNNSSNFDKITWDFGDGVKSSELNPSHIFSNNNDRKIKLVAENNEKQKDSITIVFPYNKWQNETLCESYLIDLSNYKYVSKLKYFSYPGGSHTYSIGSNYNENQLPFHDSIILKNSSPEITFFVKYYTEGKITSYRKHSTIDLSNFFTDLTSLQGSYYFNERIKVSSNGPPEYYNDTTLTISFSNGLILLEDKVLHHKFTGYLSSLSNNNEYVFKYGDYRIDKTTISQNVKFSRITNSVVAEHVTYWSNFGHSTKNTVTYKGYK